MAYLIRWMAYFLGSLIFSLRYRVRVKGLDDLRGLKKAIILPNHPAYMDPPLTVRTLWPILHPRPMIYASIFHNPLLFWLPRVLDAIEIPDLQQHSGEAREQTQHAIGAIVDGLKAGNNHILWPAGRVYHQGHESLGPARSLSEILAAVPDAQIVVVRTRGLWGSMFSYARTGEAPNLAMCLIKGMGILLANLIFFTPRRPVDITIERIDRSKLPGLSREQINPFFEAWYNAPGAEEPSFTPYHFLFGARTFVFPKIGRETGIDPAGVKPATREAVAQLVAEKLKRDAQPGDQDPSAKLEDLGLDSLDRMELSLEVERRFGFASAQVPLTIGELWALSEGKIENAATPSAPAEWFKLRPADAQAPVMGDTMPQAFVRRALASGRQIAAADDSSGVVTYERMLVGAILMSRRIAALPSANVGLLLPASVAMNLLFMGTHLTGKVPVLLNWTTGPANLAHAAQVMGLTHVITSRRFIDRTGITIQGVQYVFVEDIRAQMGKLEMLAVLFRVRFMSGSVLRATPSPDVHAPAAVLFTSGSEKAPKAVPLTHENIISNIRAVREAYKLVTADVLVGFLPSFHSFGLTVTSVLPMLIGARVVYHPDPTDSSAIARKIGSYKGTVLCSTPTFLSYIMDRARPHELETVRIAVVGAEKCPDTVYQRAAELMPHLKLIEGYGITECAPIVSCNRLEHVKQGSIGLPVPGVRVEIVDVDTNVPVAQGQMGMLLVAGPNVFPGYLGADAPNPFLDRDGVRWYVTGDLGRRDEDGFLWFMGRLKRFIKAGGEMISLPAIEEPLARRYPPDEQGPRVAVEGVETDGGRRIVLFTTEPMVLRQANQILQEQGIRGVMRFDEVRRIEKIPVLGTGKIDYKVLRAMITR